MLSSLSPVLRRRLFALLAFLGLAGWLRAAEDIHPVTRAHIEALLEEKAARSPAERKLDSQLVYFAKQSRNLPIAAAVPTLELPVQANAAGRVLVDIRAAVSEELLAAITDADGEIVSQSFKHGAIRARLPAAAFAEIAGRDDVRFVEPARLATTNLGAVTTEGDRTHRADTARTTFTTGGGSGLKIGVLSDGVDSLAASKASGDLNASATVLAGQEGSGDEGTAMMEIIQDIVPNAQLYFATAFGGPTGMADNILALQAAGCTIIVDDVTYFYESPFQDQVIAQAVSTVSAAGVMYFSSARNSGSKDKGTSGTWEGDFADGGATSLGSKGGSVHDFGGGVTTNIVTSISSPRADLFWSDPLGASTNDYDLFVVNAAGTVLRSSTNVQNGTQDPYESVSTLAANERIVIVKAPSAAARFLHLDTGRSRLTVSTAGNVRGHNAAGATNAFSVAASDVHNAPSPGYFTGGASNPVETFSSDGPRRMFFQSDGTPYTPGNFSATGGVLLNKPDFTAADGGSTTVAGFTTFYGTSAAAPHAAAVAALLKSYNPALTPAQIRTLLTSTALDIEGAGYDRTSGSGIIMALAALQAAPSPDPLSVTTSGLAASGVIGGPFSPASGSYTLTNNSGTAFTWSAAATQSWLTLSSTGGTLGAGASTTITATINATANSLGAGVYSDTVTITNVTSGFSQAQAVTLTVGVPHATLFDSFTGASVTSTGSTPRSYMGLPFTLGSSGGTTNITVSSGTAYLAAASSATYTNVRLNLTFWGAVSGATSGATAAFSNLLGSCSFDLGPLTAVSGTMYTYTFTLPTPIVLPAQTGGVTVNWQGDTGGGLASTDALTSVVRYGAVPAVGTLPVGTAGTNGYYRNASSETNGNFLGSSFRSLSGLTNQSLALQLFGPPSPPLALTEAATSVGAFVATLNASVNPAGGTTVATFEYGPTTGYGSTAAITLSPSNGTTVQSVSANLTGLTAGTTYHYRVTAASSYGTTHGRDLTFTTPANVIPTISGAVAGQTVRDTASLAPFQGVTLGDTDAPAQTLAVSVTLDTAAKGTFTTLSGFTAAGGGVYTYSGTAAAATTALRGLIFTPTPGRLTVGATETVTFTISVNDTSGAVTNSTTTLVVTALNHTFTTLAGLAGAAGSTDATGAAARFNAPAGLAVDSAGYVYVSDSVNHVIRKIAPGGAVTTLAGSAGNSGSSDGTGTGARFNTPQHLAVDSSGNVYVADGSNHTIRKVTPAGVVTTLAGSAGNTGSTDATGSSARFNYPRGIAVDTSGNVYVGDHSNHTIRKVTPAGVVTTFAGLAGATGTTDNTGPLARFYLPFGVAVGGTGTVYVGDYGNLLVRAITTGGVVSSLAGSAGNTGSVDGTGTAARFNTPMAIAVDAAGKLFIGEYGNDTIREMPSGGLVTTIGGLAGNSGSADGAGPTARFSAPVAVAADSVGNVYVADYNNHTVRWGALSVPALTSATTASGAVGSVFTGNVTFSGTLGGTYTASGLPAGLALASATGALTGTPTVAGTYTVTLGATNGAGAGSGTLTLTIAKGSQTITFAALADKSYGDAPFTVGATASSGLSPTFSIVSGPATISGSTVTLTGAGTVVVRAAQAGNANYDAAANVDRSFTVAANFASWQAQKFTAGELLQPAVSGATAIFGQDGLSNLVKYALGLEPKQNATSGLPDTATLGTDWTFTYTRPASVTDVTYVVEVSTNLSTWTAVGVTHALVSTNGTTETWRGRYPISSAPNVFFRLKVTQP